MNLSRSGLLTSGGSIGSLNSSITLNDLPNLPGVRRDVSQLNPKMYKEFKMSQSRGSLFVEDEKPQLADDQSLASYFDDASKFDFARVSTAFPQDGSAYNDLTGRYSLVSQRRDRTAQSRSLPYSSTSSLPPFVTHDGRVCCFIAYFVEPATDVTDERCRKVHIKVYTDDDSIEIVEPKIENSGTLQGKFLKRHQVFKPVQRLTDKKQLLTIADMFAGAEVPIYNRVYTIIDCDASTRAEMTRRGLIFGSSLPVPSTLYDPRTRSGATRATSRSAASAGLSLVQRANPAATGRGFFEYDRQVLRFFGLWDSRSQLFGDLLQVKLHYYLADDKIEIVSVLDRNSGRDPLPTLLKKTRLVKRSTEDEDVPERASPLTPERYYHWKDLHIGTTVTVAAMEVRLVDADEFTRSFYQSNRLALGPPLPMEAPVYPTVHNEIPPYNGFGSEEDSLQTCKASLIPSAPMKDGLKAKLFQGMILRYSAKLQEPTEADKSREFIIQVHLEDDTFQIREPPIRNSGHQGGIFLQRCKLETHDGSQPLQPQDLHIGATVSILSHKFKVLDCDQFTFKYMSANPSQWTYSDLRLVEQKLLEKKEVLQRILLTLPALASRSLVVSELAELIEKSGLSLVLQEVHTIFRAVDPYGTGSVKATKVLKHIMDI